MTSIDSEPYCIDFAHLERAAINELLTELLVPRPIGWIVSRDARGATNLAPFSSLAPVCNDPPVLVFSAERNPGGLKKRTASNILSTKEFVVHLVDRTLIEKTVATALPGDCFPDKFFKAGVTTGPCRELRLPRILECPTAFECRLWRHVVLGSKTAGSDVLFGRIVAVWTRAGVSAAPVGALGIGAYLAGGSTVLVANPMARAACPPTDSSTQGHISDRMSIKSNPAPIGSSPRCRVARQGRSQT